MRAALDICKGKRGRNHETIVTTPVRHEGKRGRTKNLVRTMSTRKI
ncbi:hypothetical protein Gogos_020876 [Gossypium gossypioides]|uniref:Uncharacterized protein n=1 Tax=Gossypium gossypioides TaxID=34282 RepID=A0A7J9D194_GOSGO|nr:hypothetical protein [Gossypium gossypioides]